MPNISLTVLRINWLIASPLMPSSHSANAMRASLIHILLSKYRKMRGTCSCSLLLQSVASSARMLKNPGSAGYRKRSDPHLTAVNQVILNSLGPVSSIARLALPWHAAAGAPVPIPCTTYIVIYRFIISTSHAQYQLFPEVNSLGAILLHSAC